MCLIVDDATRSIIQNFIPNSRYGFTHGNVQHDLQYGSGGDICNTVDDTNHSINNGCESKGHQWVYQYSSLLRVYFVGTGLVVMREGTHILAIVYMRDASNYFLRLSLGAVTPLEHTVLKLLYC